MPCLPPAAHQFRVMVSSFSSTQSCPIAELTCALLLLAGSSPLAVVELPSSYGTKKCFLGLPSLEEFTGQTALTYLSVFLTL